MSDEEGTRRKTRVAEYLRMSTDHQQYSLQNQSTFNQDFAKKHDMEIIVSYTDSGKSGVTIAGRQGLQQLIEDITRRRIGVEAVLVYDVSRFGRFQDINEPAYYEFLLKTHGVKVIYCAEPISDAYPEASMLILNTQRFGAAAYSKNLSDKVFIGQVNLVKRGYRQGGSPGYGLRRQLIDESHNPKQILILGQKKSIQTDRVILVPGPENELFTVSRIFSMFVKQYKPERVIASELNRENIAAENGALWTRGKIHQILTNEKYIGNNVYNKTSFKLKKAFIKNEEKDWVRCDNAFEPIIDKQIFYEAQEIIRLRSERLSDEQLLHSLKDLYKKKGYLSGFIIDEEDLMPSSSIYRSRFGGLLRAYSLINYKPEHDYSYIDINRNLRCYHSDVVNSLISEISSGNNSVEKKNENTLLRINNEFDLSIIISRCQHRSPGRRRWKVRFENMLSPDITIAVRMDDDNKCPLDYYIIPAIDNIYDELLMNDMNPWYLDLYRFDSLAPLFEMVERVILQEAV
ncbi:Recombinase [Salmonella enterica]|nr:Recombinase [Salmonella enterica]